MEEITALMAELVKLGILIFAVKFFFEFYFKEKKTRTKRIPKVQSVYVDYSGYKDSYVKKSLLTKREAEGYKILRDAAQKRNLLICPKVRLLDLVEPKQDARNHNALLTKVMSKHVDFVICNQDMEVICIIELDDTTHLRQDRIERDQFVDTVLKGTGYKIIHTWEITPDIFDFMDIHIVRNGPTFEEWKEQRMKEKAQEKLTD